MKNRLLLFLKNPRFFCLFSILGSFFFCALIGLLFAKRSIPGAFEIHCAPQAKIEVTVLYSRFEAAQLDLLLTPDLGAPSKILAPDKFEKPYYPDANGWTSILNQGVLSRIDGLRANCEGFAGLQLHGYKTYHLNPDESGIFKVPKRFLVDNNWWFWSAGFLLCTIMVFIVIQELRSSSSPNSHPLTKALPWFNLAFVGIFYFILFPGYINSFNPHNVVMSAQIQDLEVWEGSLYMMLISALIAFIPAAPVAILPQNLVVFLVLQRLTFLGKSWKQNIILSLAFPALCLAFPLIAFHTQYFDRAALASWLCILLLLEIFKFVIDRKSDEFDKKSFFKILGITLLLCLLRYEYFLIFLFLPFFFLQKRPQRLAFILAIALSAIFLPTLLDRSKNNEWRIRYYVVSLWPYYKSLVDLNKLDEDETRYLNNFYNVDILKNENSLWAAMRFDTPFPQDSPINLSSVIVKYALRDPKWLFQHLITQANGSLMMSPQFEPRHGMSWTPHRATPESLKLLDMAIFSITSGTVKIPGDPFYRGTEDIADQFIFQKGLYLNYGFVFLVIGALMIFFLPGTGIFCLAILAKYLVVGALAPSFYFTYTLDIFLACGLAPILGTFELFLKRHFFISAWRSLEHKPGDKI